MGKIKWYKGILMILFCLFLTGCGKVLPNTYQEGGDYQYMENYVFIAWHQQGEGVQYFARNHFIYYLDKNGALLPLCGKADCMHDKETDAKRVQACNAHMVRNAIDTGIAYSNGYLYYVDEDARYTLYRVSADGMKKEEVYQWEENTGVEQWIVHRGVFYYAEHVYLSEKEGVEEQFSLKALSLTERVKKPKTVFTADKGMDVLTIAHPNAYGNYIYFQIHAQKKHGEEEDGKDGEYKSLYFRTFIYDLRQEKLSELALSDTEKDSVIIQGVVFWQDKILFAPYDLEKDELEPRTWYMADLDGTHKKVFMERVEQGMKFFSDGKYLYLSNLNLVQSGKEKGNGKYKIYDKDLKMVDSVTLPFDMAYGAPAIGDSKRMYMLYEKELEDDKGEETENEEVEWGVSYWDKSKIGSYHGDAFEMTDIKYEG